MGYIRLILVGIFISLTILYLSEIGNKYFRMNDPSWEKTTCVASRNIWVSGRCSRVEEGLKRTIGKRICWKKWINGMCDIELVQPMTMNYIGKTIFIFGIILVVFNFPIHPTDRLYW